MEIALKPVPTILQQHGFVHAGGGECHCRYSDRPSCVNSLALGARVRTTKLKINLVRSLMEIFSVARGRFGKAGRIRTFTQTEVFARADGKEKLVALHAATFMPIEGRGDICNERFPRCGRIALLMRLLGCSIT